MTPLASLLAAVESGIPAKNIDFSAIGDYDDITLAGKSCEGSTDAAISLCEAMLPGVCWRIENNQAEGCCASLALLPVAIDGFADTPARALFIATLRARVAMEETS